MTQGGAEHTFTFANTNICPFHSRSARERAIPLCSVHSIYIDWLYVNASYLSPHSLGFVSEHLSNCALRARWLFRESALCPASLHLNFDDGTHFNFPPFFILPSRAAYTSLWAHLFLLKNFQSPDHDGSDKYSGSFLRSFSHSARACFHFSLPHARNRAGCGEEDCRKRKKERSPGAIVERERVSRIAKKGREKKSEEGWGGRYTRGMEAEATTALYRTGLQVLDCIRVCVVRFWTPTLTPTRTRATCRTRCNVNTSGTFRTSRCESELETETHEKLADWV